MLTNPKRYKDILRDQQVKSNQYLYVHLFPLARSVVLLAIAAICAINDLVVLNAKTGGYYPMITFILQVGQNFFVSLWKAESMSDPIVE